MSKGRSSRQYSLPELAETAGMTVRNVRSYQTRGLIPAPQRQGRRSVYSEEHLRRLREIHSARQRGASLTLIAVHLSNGGNLSDTDRQRNWIPKVLTGSRRRPAETRSAQVCDLLSDSPAEQHLRDRLDALVDAGVLIRRDEQVLTDPQLSTMLQGLVDRGLELPQIIDVMVVSAGAAAEIGKVVEGALPTGRTRESGRRELMSLVQLTLDSAITHARP